MLVRIVYGGALLKMLETLGELAQAQQGNAESVTGLWQQGRVSSSLRQAKALLARRAGLAVVWARAVRYPQSPKDREGQRALAHLLTQLSRASPNAQRLQ